MSIDSYEFWTDISPAFSNRKSENSRLSDPLQHLQENYQNVKSPISYSGISNIYNYYGGRLSHKKIKDFLASVNTYTLHKKSRVTGYNPSFIRYHRQQMQLDLIDVQKLSLHNDDYRFLLMAIDCFTRYGFSIPLKNKTSIAVLNGFKSILRKAGKLPHSVMTDGGTEFINSKFIKFCEENSIRCHRSYTSTHASFVERFNRTIKNKLYTYMDGARTERYIDVLEDLINSYNNSIHRMIGLKPAEAELKKNHMQVRERMQQYYSKFSKQKPKYKIGDTVRITAIPNQFHRGFEIQNKNEIFVVSEINTKLPRPLYKLHTFGNQNEIIKGSFYENELTHTKINQFYIEKILKKTKNKVLVKWEGYSVPTWEPRKYIESVFPISNYSQGPQG